MGIISCTQQFGTFFSSRRQKISSQNRQKVSLLELGILSVRRYDQHTGIQSKEGLEGPRKDVPQKKYGLSSGRFIRANS